MKVHHIRTSKTARYFLLGQSQEPIQQVWFVCHGYGQLASYFGKHFEGLVDGQTLIVVPEGLSRFYVDGFTGRIGASWMTREDRLHEIDDMILYLNKVHDEVFSRCDCSKAKVVCLGFSQGVATVCRWVSRGQVKADKLVLWAGTVPPDLGSQGLHKLSSLECYLVFGSSDEYIDNRLIASQEELLQKYKIPYQLITFDGQHEFSGEILLQVAGQV